MYRIRMSHILSVSMVFLLLVGIGCSTQQSADKPDKSGKTSIANKFCPIKGHEVNSDGKTVQWKDKTIGFCCDECVPVWNNLSDDEKTEKLAKAGRENDAGKKMKGHEKHKH